MKPWERNYQDARTSQPVPKAAPWERNYEAEEPERSRLDEFTGAANRRIAKTAGFGVDSIIGIMAMTGAADKLGIPYDSIGSSESILKFLNWLNIPTEDKDTAYARAGRYLVDGMTMTAALVKKFGTEAAKEIMGRISTGTPTERVLTQMTKPVIQRPVGTLSAEVAGAGGAAAGGKFAEEEFGPEYRALGELLGGLTGAQAGDIFGQYAARSTPRISMKGGKPKVEAPPNAKWATTKLSEAINPKRRASARLAETSEDINAAIKNLDEAPQRVSKGAYATPASKTRDKHLMQLEKNVIDEDPAIYNYVDKQTGRTRQILKQQIDDIHKNVSVEKAQKELASDLDYHKELLDQRLIKAESKVKNTTAKLGAAREKADLNRLARNELESAFTDARTHEKELWKLVDDTIPVTDDVMKEISSSYKANVAEYLDETAIPGFMKNKLGIVNSKGELSGGKRSAMKTMEALKKYRSDLGATIRRARADGDMDKARVLSAHEDDVYDAMKYLQGDDALDTAVGFSRSVAERFKRGEVGKIMGFSREGGMAVDADLTLTSTIGAGGEKGAVALRQLREALGFGRTYDGGVARNIDDIVEDYLKAKIKFVNSEGRVRVESAANYLDNNSEQLKHFPELRKQIQNAIDEEKSYKALEREIKRATTDLNQSIQASVAGGKPVRVANTILENQDATKNTAKLWAKLSEEGRKGMKGAYIDYLLTKIREKPLDDIDDFGDMMRTVYQANEASYKIVFTKAERQRLKRIMQSVSESQFEGRNLPKVHGTLTDIWSKVFEMPARVAGAKVGAAIGGGGGAGPSLQSAQMGSARAKELSRILTRDKAKKLLQDAVFDEELYRSLLVLASQRAQKPTYKAKRAWNVVQGWMIANVLGSAEQTAEGVNNE